MSTTQGPFGRPESADGPYSAELPYGPQLPYQGQAGYGAPTGPGGYGWMPPPPPPSAMWRPEAPRRKRRGLLITAAGTAFALAVGGTAWATIGSGGNLSTAEIAARVNPGLVDVISTLGYRQAAAAGTGMVLTSDGEVLTNNHVIAGATSIKVRDIGNGRTYSATVVGYSDRSDVAVLQLTGASGLATVPIGDSSHVRVGHKVVALGNAEGRGGTPAVATGSVTGLGSKITAVDQGTGVAEQLSGMIRTDANIQPGDSGGPLVNSAGQVIGMDTAAGNSRGVGTASSVSTMAFSIPINRALGIANQIEAGRSSATVHVGATAFLGVGISSAQSGSAGLGQTGTGAIVAGVIPGTAAARAGLSQGDIIESVGGHAVASASGLQTVIETYHPGDRVSVTWTDQFGQRHTANVTLTQGPAG